MESTDDFSAVEAANPGEEAKIQPNNNVVEMEYAVYDGEVRSGADPGDRKKPTVVNCPHCEDSGFKDTWFLKRNIERMHLVPIKCEIGIIVFIDKYCYINHSKNCFYFCPREGCTFHDKRKSRLDGHVRRHERES